jgi:hypothetical protein
MKGEWKNWYWHKQGWRSRPQKLAKALWDEVARVLSKEGKQLRWLKVGEPLDEEACILAYSYARKNKRTPETKP